MGTIINKNYLGEYLSQVQNNICYANATEAPYSSEYTDFDEAGIYVDITNGKPLFLSIDKYSSHCGWPSFTTPIDEDYVEYINDDTLGMVRIEVRTAESNIHLGHVFSDGPVESGGRRFCINGATLDFIEYEELEDRGYGECVKHFEKK